MRLFTGRHRRLARYALILAIVVPSTAGGVLASTPPAAASEGTVVVRWNEEVLAAVRDSGIGPPMIARALAMVHTCMYDAWAAYDLLAAGTRFGGALRRPLLEHTTANKTEAISYAAHRAAVDLFPASEPELDAFLASLGFDPELDPIGTTTPPGVGVTACEAVLSFRHLDGSNQNGDLAPGAYSDWTGYQPVNDPMVVADPIDPATVVDPNHWQPLTYPDRDGTIITPSYLGAHWGHVTPFALLSGSQFRSLLPPAKFGTPAYVQQANDVLNFSAGLTDRQKAIAEYWADGPSSEQPPGHWNLFAQFVSARDGHALDQDVKMFFMVANAVMDAGIAAWDDKRAFDYVRPITAIRYMFRGQPVTAWAGPGQGTQVIDGGEWRPYQPTFFPTPPFGEYVSGHSTFSSAAAEVLKLFTGSDAFGFTTTIPAGSSDVEPGLVPADDTVLSYPTFTAAANQAGISRLYGGIHFPQANTDGLALGRLVGTEVWLKSQLCFLGVCG